MHRDPEPTPAAPLPPDGESPLAGRRVLVSGGSGGLGAAVVARVAQLGGWPLVVDRLPPRHPVAAYCGPTDLADTGAAEAAVRRHVEQGGSLDAVVTCAGIDLPGSLDTMGAADWERVVAVNLLATVAVVRAALPGLLERHGQVVTIASTLGHRVAADATAYCASKWGVVGFTRALALELKGRVGVTLVTPGGMRTGFFDGRAEQYRPAPDAPLADPVDVAEAIVFALSRPPGLQLAELVVTGPLETSWP